MKLEDGKYYLTSDGYKVGPIVGFDSGKWFYCEGVEEVWGADGKNKYSGVDLIAEWQDDPSTGTLAELNVKPGDVVELMEPDTFRGEGAMYEIKLGPSGLMYAQHDDGVTVNFASSWLFRMQSPSPSPVRTVTRKEIVPGVYGKVSVLRSDGWWFAFTDNGDQVAHVKLDRDDLTAAIETLTAIRDALA